jgi:propionate CoA-transferase
MRKVKIMTAEEAANFVGDGMTLASSGFVGSAIPESLTKALEKDF